MKAIFVRLVFMILVAIGLGIYALIIALGNKNVVSRTVKSIPAEDLVQKYGKYEDNVARLKKLAELDSSTYKMLDLNELQSSDKKLDAIEIVPNYLPGANFIFIVCGMRANDFEAARACMELAESDLPEKFPNMNFIIAPIANPEGYDFALLEDQNWTKNREANGDDCIGTKISQNFVHNFEQTGEPCSEDFSGNEALTTWEAKAIYSYTNQFNWEALLVIESSENVSDMKVITPAKQNSHAFRKLLPRIFIAAEGFETERPDEKRAGYLEDSVLSKFGRIATVQIGTKNGAESSRDVRALVDSFSRDILKKNSYEKVFLDDFFWEEDDIFKYELININDSFYPITTYEYNMTSLQWLDDTVNDRSVWTHTVYLIVPKVVKDPGAMFLQVMDGDNLIQHQTRSFFDDELARTQQFSINTGIVSGVIKQVPNQPIRFTDDTTLDQHFYGQNGRFEDGILAKTWYMFIKQFEATGKSDYKLLVHPSMGKAAVRALDLIAEETFVHTGSYPFKAGVVGASKRGWTCWLAAAADFERIKLNSPVVFDLLNTEASMEHLYRSLGGWTYKFVDYWYNGVTRSYGSEGMRASFKVLDPLEYKNRYADNMVTYVVNAANDEFFSLTGPLNYWDKLSGKKLLRILPDSSHVGVWGGWEREEENTVAKITRKKIADISIMPEKRQDRLWTSLEALYSAVLWAPESIPSIETSFTESSSVMKVEGKASCAPEAVRFYSRYSINNKRDWRRSSLNGSAICDNSQIFNTIFLHQDKTIFNREEALPGREQVFYLSSTEENIWHSGFIDFEFSLNGRKFVASSLPGVTPSNKWVSEMCSTPDECAGCLV